MSKAPEPQPPYRIERILAFMMVGIVLLTLASFAAVIIGTASGMQRGDFAEGIWPYVAFLPNIGLPIAALLIIALTVLGIRRRSREAGGR